VEAAGLLERLGPSEIPEERRSLLLEVGLRFWGPIPWMIEAAVVLTAVMGRWADFAVISVLLIVNGVVGFWEERQAGNAIAALRDQLAVKARGRRDVSWQTLEARVLVPGNLVHVELGQIVPADGRVISGACEVDESALTGESLPADKQVGDELHSGSVLARGQASALVTETGPRTLFGQTAKLAGAEPPPSHFQQAVLAIGRYLIVLALVLVSVIVVVSLLRGNAVSTALEFALVVSPGPNPTNRTASTARTLPASEGPIDRPFRPEPAPGLHRLAGKEEQTRCTGVRSLCDRHAIRWPVSGAQGHHRCDDGSKHPCVRGRRLRPLSGEQDGRARARGLLPHPGRRDDTGAGSLALR
jgi:H+-transporting ATPase